MKVLVTGSLGLVGSEAVRFYLERGNKVIGLDNNMREMFFGKDGSVLWNKIEHPNYTYHEMDVGDCAVLFKQYYPDVIIHCAAQPSHDWSATDPMTDFNINAVATVHLLENTRSFVPNATFIYVSTNKVYGDNPNRIPLTELKYRYEANILGIDETMSLDNCIHSCYGVSKQAGDVMAQEYGKNFGIKTGIFRAGCITGGKHSGAELHGFLSWVVKCKKMGKIYNIFGYKGKQVRDQIHAYDLVNAFDHFIQKPRPGEVYNIGGGPTCNVSVLEALKIFNVPYEYHPKARTGDHMWYVSDNSKFLKHYPEFKFKYNLEGIFDDLLRGTK